MCATTRTIGFKCALRCMLVQRQKKMDSFPRNVACSDVLFRVFLRMSFFSFLQSLRRGSARLIVRVFCVFGNSCLDNTKDRGDSRNSFFLQPARVEMARLRDASSPFAIVLYENAFQQLHIHDSTHVSVIKITCIYYKEICIYLYIKKYIGFYIYNIYCKLISSKSIPFYIMMAGRKLTCRRKYFDIFSEYLQ